MMLTQDLLTSYTDSEIARIKRQAKRDRENIPPKKPGPPRQYSDQERRRRQIKLNLRQRHAHRIDETIARLEERLTILKEIQAELLGESGNERDRCITERQD
jgi:hypothetical protein